MPPYRQATGFDETHTEGGKKKRDANRGYCREEKEKDWGNKEK